MGAGASTIEEEKKNPLDISDIDTPRGVSAKNEVKRLRKLLAEYSYGASQVRRNFFKKSCK